MAVPCIAPRTSLLLVLWAGSYARAAVGYDDHDHEDAHEHYCMGDVDMDYEGMAIAHVPNISSADLCCLRCKEVPQCRVWMWGTERGVHELTDGGDLVCTLKSVDKDERFTKKNPMKGVVSGVPYRWDRPGSIFCFSLMQPTGYERDLMDMAYKNQWGVFQCDETSVISNVTIEIGPGMTTSVVPGSLDCKFGGEFGTALNTELFLKVWDVVFDDARFEHHSWTVKVDPDCVFFPLRLRVLLAFHPDTYRGLYINNCKYGLHGPIEVLSTQAVYAWASGFKTCQQHFGEMCSGPCLWGEDMWMDQCLDKVLQVKRIDDWNLLAEDHCDSEDWQACSNHRVAFHPFKSVDVYSKCVADAEYGGMPMLV